jgi:hypothetical protein
MTRTKAIPYTAEEWERDRRETKTMVAQIEATIKKTFKAEICSGDYMVAFALAMVLLDGVRNRDGEMAAAALGKVCDDVFGSGWRVERAAKEEA